MPRIDEFLRQDLDDTSEVDPTWSALHELVGGAA
jgi:hypothetical protein